jgi:hypothetical protein
MGRDNPDRDAIIEAATLVRECRLTLDAVLLGAQTIANDDRASAVKPSLETFVDLATVKPAPYLRPLRRSWMILPSSNRSEIRDT